MRARSLSLAVRGLAAAACLAVPASAPAAAPLEVRLVHSPSFDAACSIVRGYRIDPAWSADLEARLPALREAWAADGRPVLDRALELAGERASGRRDVLLTLCDPPSSSTFGPVVNARHALPAFTRHPVPLRYKAATAAHELLHPLIAGLDLSGSRLLAAHAREPQRVRDHLHLLALMEAALVDLGREEVLAEVRGFDGALPDAAYRRAWEIVDRTPGGYRAYLDEIRSAR